MSKYRKQGMTKDQTRMKALMYCRGKAIRKAGGRGRGEIRALFTLQLLRVTMWLSQISSLFCSLWTQSPSLLSKAIAVESPDDLNQGRTSY